MKAELSDAERTFLTYLVSLRVILLTGALSGKKIEDLRKSALGLVRVHKGQGVNSECEYLHDRSVPVVQDETVEVAGGVRRKSHLVKGQGPG